MSHTLKVPLAKPRPDFDELLRVLRGEKQAQRVHFAELFVDGEIVSKVLSDFLGERPIPSPEHDFEGYWDQQIKFWLYMGYDYIRVSGGLSIPEVRHRVTGDTAALSRGERGWVEEGTGVIESWADYDTYPWHVMERMDFAAYEYVSRHLPDGMKMLVCPSSGVFEISSEYLLGFEGMSMMLYEDPTLVEAVFSRVGRCILDFYRNVVTLDNVAGIFQGDDLGFKTSTFLSPVHLRQLVLPWHKRYAALAHEQGQVYWFHSCGNLARVMDDFIDDAKIDAYNSFQDEIIPVCDFVDAYGRRVAALGGVDVDCLCRLKEDDLRDYVRRIIDHCAQKRWALGSGNSVPNYAPVRNYLVMLDEGLRWQAP